MQSKVGGVGWGVGWGQMQGGGAVHLPQRIDFNNPNQRFPARAPWTGLAALKLRIGSLRKGVSDMTQRISEAEK